MIPRAHTLHGQKMGFFSSRKHEKYYLQDDRKSVVNVIRSRFYGTRKQPDQSQTKHTDPPSFSSTDPISVTLARQLNELAAANSEGLLDSDEYRLLRQNLFERFATQTPFPTENPVVPATGPPRTTDKNASLHNQQSHKPSRPPSIMSTTSMSSTLFDFIRGSGRRSNRCPSINNETSSLFSTSSKSSRFFKGNIFHRKRSNTSIHTNLSRVPIDTISLPDREAHIRNYPIRTQLLPTPPSSFPVRSFAPDRVSGLFDEENLSTVQDICQEILAVQADAERINDVFNNLESSSSCPHCEHHFPFLTSDPQSSQDIDVLESTWAIIPETRLQRREPEYDRISTRSGVSVGTSIPTSPSSNRDVRMKPGTPSTPSSLHRKNSASSIPLSHTRRGRGVPPSPSTGHCDTPCRCHRENSSINGKNHLHKQRADVISRYDARLDYLRAKLKSVQLREKLLRQ